MERVSGWYTRNIVLLFAVVVTETLTRLYTLKQGIDELGLPVGWVVDGTQPGYKATLEQARVTQRLIPRTGADWGGKGAGLLVTMILLSLGAPFWYERLGKLVNMRNAGKPPQTAHNAAAAKTKPGG